LDPKHIWAWWRIETFLPLPNLGRPTRDYCS